jgi:hypothetical protein
MLKQADIQQIENDPQGTIFAQRRRKSGIRSSMSGWKKFHN